MRPGRILLLVAAMALLLVSCGDEKIGQVTFYNDSDHDVILLVGAGPEPLQNSLDPLRHAIDTTPPGLIDRRAFDVTLTGEGRPGAHEPWCNDETIWFIVRDRKGRTFNNDPRTDPVLSIDDVEVLEQLGPGWCWPGRVVEYHYTGD